MTAPRQIPAGRAGRVWLTGQLRTAERAVDLLERKLRVLRDEQRRYHAIAERTAEEWRSCLERAEEWLLRASLLGGQRALRLAEPDQPARIDVSWSVVMGVRYPTEATVLPDEPAADAGGPGSSALARAIEAYHDVLRAAANHAVAAQAARVVDKEAENTSRRLRAVRDRRIPRLTDSLRALDLALQELEQAENVRLRWVTDDARRHTEQRHDPEPSDERMW